ncbi:hypothetical protein OG874_03985 [Nocardia sp. NBC_00565]|uniref:hypothetical protein n=1 Tax=Nocardia sp. NBC_00565 TaxID=2975993 RepID=UPI002E81318E|nr:hypothetical protein [Nocardia sp. NBC_00565]WUC04377.1 hypothetical protein OG874_03985 [Nocardia sp. NBC_00565]
MSASVASDAPVSDVPIPGAHPPDATAPGRAVATAPTVAKAWHPWRWVVSAIALVLLAQFIHGPVGVRA